MTSSSNDPVATTGPWKLSLILFPHAHTTDSALSPSTYNSTATNLPWENSISLLRHSSILTGLIPFLSGPLPYTTYSLSFNYADNSISASLCP